MSEEYTLEIWVNANKIKLKGVLNWLENQETERTSEKISCLCYQNMGN